MPLFKPDQSLQPAMMQAARRARPMAFMSSRPLYPMGVFVTRDSATGNLMLNGDRFRFCGANPPGLGFAEYGSSYGATVDGDGLHLSSHSEIDAILNEAQAMNATAIRVYGGVCSVGKTNSLQPTLGVFNAANLEPIDYALQQCTSRGIRMWFPLVDNYQFYVNGKFWYCTVNGVTPDGNATQFFNLANTAIVNSFKAHISYVLDHVNAYTGIAYKDDPAILCWELGNELNIGAGNWTSTQVAWADAISRHIKVTKGAQQLVMDGCAYNPSGADDGGSLNIDLTYIDITTNHPYYSGALPIVKNAAEASHAHGKAYIVGEYTWNDINPSGGSNDWTLTQLLSRIDTSPFIDGDAYWQLLPPLVGVGGPTQFGLHYPGDDSPMITRVNQLSAHALTMLGAAPSPAPKTETLVDTFTSFDSAKWNLLSTASVVGGQASLPGTASAGGSAFVSDIVYDLTNSYVIVELPQRHSSTGSSNCGLMASQTAVPETDKSMGFIIEGTSIRYRLRNGGLDDISETYSATAHRWLRLRASYDAGENTGTLYWDVSDDGLHWVNKRFKTSGFSLRNLYLSVHCWNWGGDPTPGTALFDNFNSPPAATPTIYPPVKRPNRGALLQI